MLWCWSRLGSAAMSGQLAVVGIGPGDACWLTPEAQAAVAAAEALYGYAPYVDRLAPVSGQARHASDDGEENARAAAALRHAAAGARVAIVSGGDPASLPWRPQSVPRSMRVRQNGEGCEWVVPGITAMLAVAARVGAPLGHDFCAISISDNLKPWDLIERRLDWCAGGVRAGALQSGFARASMAARRRVRPAAQGVAGVDRGGVGHEAAQTRVLSSRRSLMPSPAKADMATLIIVGSADTRVISRPGRTPLVYTPRAVETVSA